MRHINALLAGILCLLVLPGAATAKDMDEDEPPRQVQTWFDFSKPVAPPPRKKAEPARVTVAKPVQSAAPLLRDTQPKRVTATQPKPKPKPVKPSPVVSSASDGALCSYCWEKGEFTRTNPEASRVLLFPARLATGVVGVPVGALTGAALTTVDAVEAVSGVTFGNLKTTAYSPNANAALTLLKAPVLLPAGIVGTAAAIPVGITYGAVTGSAKGFAKGYMYPDSW